MSSLPPLVGPDGVPRYRGRWRFTLHRRSFNNTNVGWQSTLLGELSQARTRKLSRAWNSPAELQFSLDSEDPAAALIVELATEVIAWRYDDVAGYERPMFRGVIDHSQDVLSETAATSTFTCHDHLATLGRRYLTTLYNVVQRDQDNIVQDLFANGTTVARTSSGVALTPGSIVPVIVTINNPDGSLRSAGSAQLRDRTYPPSTQIYQALDDLARVINGFDYDVQPLGYPWADWLRVFYPQQGITRSDVVLLYGGTVSALQRNVNSADYANYVRVLGNNGSADPAAPQLFSEAWNADAISGTSGAVGTWMNADNAADVSVQATLDQKAQGDLNLSGLLVPSYSLTLAPGAYRYGQPNVGDTVPLIILKGRLNVNTTIRVMGISWAIGDDGDEDVTLTVGRPPTLLYDLLTKSDRDIDALARR